MFFLVSYMRIKLLASLIILIGALSVSAQDTKCNLKLAELADPPELFGFRMGMTTAQLKQRVPQAVFGRVDDFGVLKTSISPDFDPQMDKASLRGIRTVSFDFLDGSLTSLWLGYDGSYKWKTVPEFVGGISQSLHLPNAWKPWKVRGQQLSCADFHLTVSIVAEGSSFRIVDDAAEKTVAARRQAKEEEDEAKELGDEPAGAEIVGDAKARLYYLDGCQPANEIKQENRIVFKNKEEAEKAGYKVAKACQ
jgi:hypothetical protein